MCIMSSKNLFNDNREVNIHNLSNLLLTYCKSLDETLSLNTAYLIVSIMLLRPKWKDKLEKVNKSTDEVKNFMLECYEFWYVRMDNSSCTIKMQCLFYGKYLTKEQFKVQKKEIILKNCSVFLQKLRNTYHNLTEDFSAMHSDFVKFILINEGMDDKDDLTAYGEMMTAVNSILPVSKFSSFVASNKKKKLAIIHEVSSIASGIRLYAWHINKAGRFMFNVAKLIKETLPKISEDMHEEITCVRKMLDSHRNDLENCTINSRETPELFKKKQELIWTTNYFQFVKLLKENIEEIAAETYKLDYKFMSAVEELKSVIKSGPFIRAEKAYPFYKDIGQGWKNLQLESYLLEFYSSLYFEIKEMYTNRTTIDSQEFEEIPANDFVFDVPEKSLISMTEENVRNFYDITLETHEYCAYYCSMGVLIPCIRKLGLLCLQDASYGFSTNKAMIAFQEHPNIYRKSAERYMRIMPELIITLNKEEYFRLPAINTLKKEKALPLFISEKQVQTVLHSVEENLDHTYNWNQWSMRDKAVKYADLVKMKTRSTQTDQSHFRRENCSQVYLPKDNWTQTRKEASTSMPSSGVSELSQAIKRTFI